MVVWGVLFCKNQVMLNFRWDANIFWIVLFLVLSTLFFLKTCYFDRNEYRRLVASSNRVVGIVHNIGISGDYYCSYEVNGIEYSFRKSKPYDEINIKQEHNACSEWLF